MTATKYALLRLLRRGAAAPRARACVRATMRVEEVEPRILHSADFVPAVVSEGQGAQVQMRVLDAMPVAAAQSVAAEEAPRHEIVVVDTSIVDYRQLIDDIAAQAGSGRSFDFVLIDGGSDGIARIGDALFALRDVDAIHIISHASGGAIRLGASVLDTDALTRRAAEIAAWSGALSTDADVLIYGCDVADTAAGRALVDALALLTGADVAASDDVTGNAARGGDWILEYRAGSIEAAVAAGAAGPQSWQGSLANNAPVLTGANNLTSIDEDPAANGGTLVSSLIAGKLTDADAGALAGIAVTAADNANGGWEYSTNSGASWDAFGAPSASSARLLAADANTYVRFVPNTGWNGTVSNGLTFRAWDQSSGTVGGTADTASLTSTVRDNFGAVAYLNNDGTANWSAGWVDSDANPAAGNILVNGGALELKTLVGSDSIYRQANLSGAASAALSFTYDNNLTPVLGVVTIQVSADGGANYTTLTSSPPTGAGTVSFDLTPYVAADTRIRFQMDGAALGGRYLADNIQISYVTPLNGGATAFSSATASSSITVSSVNDAPVGTGNTVTTNEDTAFTFTVAHFGFTDPSDATANNLAAVKISTLPSAGALTLSGAAVTAGQFVSLANINAGNLAFTPAANANGAGAASFTFQVQDNGGTALGGVDVDTVARTMTINVTAVNDAPVLSGANNLSTINEDAASNAGTLVSALIAGRVSDADAGALSGIAVTAVDNTNGTWQYSTNSGGTWRNLGTPSAASARLLAADANTFIRFVPNANWNGTVASGLTFRAWDQTLGMNGGVAPTIPNPVLRDNFSVVSYSNNDGTALWSGNWVDSDDGNAGGGKIRIEGGVLEVKTTTLGVSISRQADLTGATSAALSFSYNNLLQAGGGDSILLEASNNGGTSYTTIGTFSGTVNTGIGSFSANIDAYISATTQIRFRVATDSSPPKTLEVDNLQIALTAPGNGGSSAFSSAAAASSITVSSVNDAPRGTGNTVTTTEDTPVVFTTAAFGFSDSNDTPANSLQAVKITALPGAGALRLSGVAVAAGQFISAGDISAGNLVFTPAANANGAGYASFTFQVQDTGGTALGGLDLDASARTLTINVTAANDTPVGTSATVVTNEDTAYTFGTAAFGFSDADAHNFNAVKISTLPGSGALMLNGAAVAAGQFVAVSDLIAGKLVFTPAAAANGAGYATFTFQVQDDGVSANLDMIARTMTIDVTSVNDAPVGASNTVTANEDTPLVFTAAAFGFTDAVDTPSNNLLAVKIVTLSGAGSLTLSGVAVTAGQSVGIADIAGGNLVFTPAANANGAGYASFTFQVRDDGGSASGGADLDLTARAMTIDVSSVNDAPVGTNTTVGTAENTALVLTQAAFGLTDPGDTPAHNLSAVKIATLPGAGTLTLSGVAIMAGQFVSAADIAAGGLRYTPVANTSGAAYASLTFQVQDDGGGADTDTVARTLTIDVGPINHAPFGTNSSAVTAEDAPLVFSSAAFGFADPNDSPARNLLAVNITTLPAAGALTLSAIAVTAGQFISVADLDAGNLVFTPGADANGADYASFTFRVQDDGGISNGGVDLDSAARTMTIDVTAVNDAPVGADKLVTMNEDAAYVFNAAAFGFTDPGDVSANNLVAVKIAALPSAGALTLNGVALSAGQSVGAADISAGKLVYTPAANANGAGYASFTFQVQDDGGTANGGVDLDAIGRTITVDVVPVNDAPTGTSSTLTMGQDTVYIFDASRFGYSDANDTPANVFAGVSITSLPGAGSLSLSGAAVTTGQFIRFADIDAGNLVFTPAAQGSGAAYASFAFKVQDDGGGAALDLLARTVAVDVTARPAPPIAIAEVPVEPPAPAPAPAPLAIASASPSAPAAPKAESAAPAPAAKQSAPTAAQAAAEGTAGDSATGTERGVGALLDAAPVVVTQTFVQGTGQRLDGQQNREQRAPVVTVLSGIPVAMVQAQNEQFSDSAMTFSALQGGATLSATMASAAVENREMVQGLNEAREKLSEQTRLEASAVAASAMTTMGVSVGYVVWLLRGGVLVSTVLSSLPAWRLVDPLPILERLDEDDEDDEGDDAGDDTLESLVARNNQAADTQSRNDESAQPETETT